MPAVVPSGATMTPRWFAYVAKVAVARGLGEDASPDDSRLREWERAVSDARQLPLPNGAECRHLRASLGLSEREMAGVAGVNSSDIRRWEAGNCPPRPDGAAWQYASLLRFLACQVLPCAAMNGSLEEVLPLVEGGKYPLTENEKDHATTDNEGRSLHLAKDNA